MNSRENDYLHCVIFEGWYYLLFYDSGNWDFWAYQINFYAILLLL